MVLATRRVGAQHPPGEGPLALDEPHATGDGRRQGKLVRPHGPDSSLYPSVYSAAGSITGSDSSQANFTAAAPALTSGRAPAYRREGFGLDRQRRYSQFVSALQAARAVYRNDKAKVAVLDRRARLGSHEQLGGGKPSRRVDTPQRRVLPAGTSRAVACLRPRSRRCPVKKLALALALAVAALAVSAALGCKRNDAAGAPSEAPQPAAVPDREWQDGILPPAALEGTPVPGGTLRVRIHADPPSLNLITHSDLWVARLIVGPVQEGLLRINEKDAPRFRPMPALAESWERSKDGRVYTFKLRRNVRFHDGSPFTAHDVVATFDRIMDERVRSMHLRSAFADLDRGDKSLAGKGYKALDDHTFRVAYTKPYFMVLYQLSDVPIQPKHLIQVAGTTVTGSTDAVIKLQPGHAARFKVGQPVFVPVRTGAGPNETRTVQAVGPDAITLDRALAGTPPGAGATVEVDYNNDPAMLRAPIGTGPFKFVRWEPDKLIELSRNDDYWGAKAHLDKVAIRVVANHTVATQLFERGEFDVMTEIQPTVWVDMNKTARWVTDYHRVRFFYFNYSWIGWNERRPFFKDERVRQAMTYLYDRAGFLKNALKGLEKPTTCPYYFDHPGCDPALKPYPYDPQKATALLDEAGWKDSNGDGVRDKDNVPFRFTFLMPENSVTLTKLTPVLKEAYRKAGIDMEIAKVEWAVFTERLRDGDFDACSLLWGDTHTESDPRQIWHSSQIGGGSNYIAYKNAEVDALIEKATAELDDDKRNASFRRIHQVLHEEQPYTWMFVRGRLEAIHRKVKNLPPTIVFYDFAGAYIDPTWKPLDAAAQGPTASR